MSSTCVFQRADETGQTEDKKTDKKGMSGTEARIRAEKLSSYLKENSGSVYYNSTNIIKNKFTPEDFENNLVQYGQPYAPGEWPDKAAIRVGGVGGVAPRDSKMTDEVYEKLRKAKDEELKQGIISNLADFGTSQYDDALLTNFSGQHPDNRYAKAQK